MKNTAPEETAPDQPQIDPQIAKAFNRHPSVAKIKGEIPPRTIYAKLIEPNASKGLVKPGDFIQENVSVFWEDPNLKVHFEIKNDDWVFKFNQTFKGYFSLSWSLNGAEIGDLLPSQILSVCFDDIVNTTGQKLSSEYSSRLNFIRGNSEKQVPILVGKYGDKIVAGKSLQAEGIDYTMAYRLWIDFMLFNANTRSVVFKNPMFLIQKELTL